MSLQRILHQVHGYRVDPMSKIEISRVALSVAKRLGLKKGNIQNLDKVLDEINDIVTIELLSEEEWEELTHNLTKGHYSPTELTIRIPEATYISASKGDKYALEVILHELGHMFLLHQTLLHKSDTPPTINEDPEWQADTFAEIILESMGYNMRQLSLDLGIPKM